MGKTKIDSDNYSNIISLYLNGHSTTYIGKQYQVTKECINNVLKKNNIPRRQPREAHTINQFDYTFFSNGVNSAEAAYVLGLLFADGYNNEKRGIIKLDLQKQDCDILKKINTLLKSNVKIKEYVNTTSYGTCVINRLVFTNIQFSQDLKNLGCVQKKSLILKYPRINPQYFFSFLLGYFDGDGSLTLTKTKYFDPSWNIVSTLDMCTNIQTLLKKLINVNSQIYKVKTVYYLKCKGTRQLDLLLHSMYASTFLHIDRKYQKYQNYLYEVSLLKRRH